MNVGFDTPDTCVSNLGSGRLFRQTWRMADFVVGPEAADEDTGPVTIYDIQASEDRKVRVRALPRLTLQALRIAWAAGRSEFVVSTLLQIVGGGGIVLLLLLGQQGLQALLDALQAGQSLTSVAPWAIAIACVAGIQSFVNAVQRERQEILGEVMQRHIEEQYAAQSAQLNLGAVEVQVGAARRRAALTLIVRAVLCRPVRMLGSGAQAEETQLADPHARPEFDRQRRDIGQFESDVPGKPGIDEACGGMSEQAEPAKR